MLIEDPRSDSATHNSPLTQQPAHQLATATPNDQDRHAVGQLAITKDPASGKSRKKKKTHPARPCLSVWVLRNGHRSSGLPTWPDVAEKDAGFRPVHMQRRGGAEMQSPRAGLGMLARGYAREPWCILKMQDYLILMRGASNLLPVRQIWNFGYVTAAVQQAPGIPQVRVCVGRQTRGWPESCLLPFTP